MFKHWKAAMALHDTRYKHYEGEHLGIWRRRWVIASHSLRSSLQNKWMRHLLTVCWTFSLALAGVLFLIGQLLVSDSVIVRWVGHMGPQLRGLAEGLTTWLEEHPEVSVSTTQNLLLYFASNTLLTFSLVAIALILPHLVTRDISSKAIIIYTSKAIGRLDYLLGKWGAVFGLLILTWFGPLVVGWLIGNLLSPRWHFFWHSRLALEHMLLFTLVTMMFLSILALGVSATFQQEKGVVGLWIGLWLLVQAFINIPFIASWAPHFSFTYNINQVGLAIFKLNDSITLAQESVPFIGFFLQGIQSATRKSWEHPDLRGSLIAMGIILVAVSYFLARRIKTE